MRFKFNPFKRKEAPPKEFEEELLNSLEDESVEEHSSDGSAEDAVGEENEDFDLEKENYLEDEEIEEEDSGMSELIDEFMNDFRNSSEEINIAALNMEVLIEQVKAEVGVVDLDNLTPEIIEKINSVMESAESGMETAIEGFHSSFSNLRELAESAGDAIADLEIAKILKERSLEFVDKFLLNGFTKTAAMWATAGLAATGMGLGIKELTELFPVVKGFLFFFGPFVLAGVSGAAVITGGSVGELLDEFEKMVKKGAKGKKKKKKKKK